MLGAAACAALAALDPFGVEVPPTRLERYISCPFKYLLRDVLGLFAPEEPEDGLEIDPLEFGILVHGSCNGRTGRSSPATSGSRTR